MGWACRAWRRWRLRRSCACAWRRALRAPVLDGGLLREPQRHGGAQRGMVRLSAGLAQCGVRQPLDLRPRPAHDRLHRQLQRRSQRRHGGLAVHAAGRLEVDRRPAAGRGRRRRLGALRPRRGGDRRAGTGQRREQLVLRLRVRPGLVQRGQRLQRHGQPPQRSRREPVRRGGLPHGGRQLRYRRQQRRLRVAPDRLGEPAAAEHRRAAGQRFRRQRPGAGGARHRAADVHRLRTERPGHLRRLGHGRRALRLLRHPEHQWRRRASPWAPTRAAGR